MLRLNPSHECGEKYRRCYDVAKKVTRPIREQEGGNRTAGGEWKRARFVARARGEDLSRGGEGESPP